jgi:hypothetical protein
MALVPCTAFLNEQITNAGLGFAVRSEHVMLGSFAFSLVGFIAGSLLFPDNQSADSSDATDEGANP